MHIRGSGALESVRGALVHLLVVGVWVGSEGFVGGGGARREGLSVEFGDGVVADEFAGLVLRSVSFSYGGSDIGGVELIMLS